METPNPDMDHPTDTAGSTTTSHESSVTAPPGTSTSPTRTRRRISPTLAVCVIAGLVTAAGLARPAATAPAAPEASVAGVSETNASPSSKVDTGIARTEPIEIASFAYNEVTVPPGAIVEVRNLDGAPHTVTATEGAFFTPEIAGPGAATFAAPELPGTYAYFCAIHPSMQGNLIVE